MASGWRWAWWVVSVSAVWALGLTAACGDEETPSGGEPAEDVGDEADTGGGEDVGDEPDVGGEDEPDARPDVEDTGDAEDGANNNPMPGRGLCEPCETNEECGGPADLCIQLPNQEGSTCARDCVADPEGCPEGYGCATVDGMEEVRQCVPLLLLCDNPCEGVTCEGGQVCHPTTGECGAPLGLCELGCLVDEQCGGAADRCLVLPDTGEQICSQDCALTPCPAGYFCAAIGPVAAPEAMQCVPNNLTCVDRCQGVRCEPGQACDPIDGTCGTQLGLCDQGCESSALCGTSDDDICIALGTPDDETICATACDTALDCPVNYFCAALDGRARGVCVPLEITCRTDRCDGVICQEGENCDLRSGECVASTLRLCDPCPGDSITCGGPLDLCLNLGDAEGVVCTQDCSGAGVCPEGYNCVQLTNTTRRACIPAGGDCRPCDSVECAEGETCNPLTQQCVAPPVSCAQEACPLGQVCNPDSTRCELINEVCTFDTRVEDCFGPVRKCSATRRGTAGVCAVICEDDGDCSAESPRCEELYRVGPLCVPEGLGGPSTCGISALEGVTLGRPCGLNVTARCEADAPVCVEGAEAGVPGFCSKPCAGDADCGGSGTCQQVRGRAERMCLPSNCLCLAGQAVPNGTTDLVVAALAPFGGGRCAFSLEPTGQAALDPATPGAPLKTPGVASLVAQPLSAVEVGEGLRDALRGAAGGGFPARDAVIVGAGRLQVPLLARVPEYLVPDRDLPVIEGLRRVVEAGGGVWSPAAVQGDVGAIPAAQVEGLVRVLFAVGEVIEARRGVTDALGLDAGGIEALWRDAPWLVLPPAAGRATPELSDPGTRALYEGIDLAPLLQAGADLSAAIEAAGFDAEGWESVDLRVQTPAGWIILGASGASMHDPSVDPALGQGVALLLDVSGDDVYRFAAGATASPTQPVGVVIDLGGADTWGYAEVADPRDVAAWLPSDAAGRMVPEGPPIRYNGAVSLSDVPRQGAGRLGVGLLFDLGASDDTYRSLRMSQGAGVLGVGVLFDDGGDDTFALEAFGQGAGLLGVGALVALGASEDRDSLRAWHAAQGFGGARGAGVLLHGGGTTNYTSVQGTGPADALYFAPPDRSLSNLNLSLGAGAGVFPADERNPDRQALGGGVGVLCDLGGDDIYAAGVWAVGVGYHLGAGFLLDQDGADTYDVRFGGLGAGDTAAVGVLVDFGGDDRYGLGGGRLVSGLAGFGVNMGAGVLVDAGGADRYALPTFSGGAGLDNGVGACLDLGGADVWDGRAVSTLGSATLSEALAAPDQARAGLPTRGLFIDAGVDADSYMRVDQDGSPGEPIGDDRSWTQRTSPDPTLLELGAGIDGAGLTGYEPSP